MTPPRELVVVEREGRAATLTFGLPPLNILDLDLLAALSRQTDVSVGCYCADESRCHRSVLRELLAARGALLA